MGKHVRLAIVGCGGMARGHLRSFADIRARGYTDFTIVATMDPKIERAEEFAVEAERFQGEKPKTFTRLEDMMETVELDAVDIVAPHGYHHKLAIPLLEKKIHVMVEKPIGVTAHATLAMIRAADKAGVILATAENIRRHLPHRTMYWALHELNLLGQLRMFLAQSTAPKPADAQREPMQWRVERIVGGGGQVFDSGAHWCDTVVYLFGDVDRVFGQTRTFTRRTFTTPERGEVVADVEDSWSATLAFKSGMVGVWTSFTAAIEHPFSQWVIFGEKGTFEDTSGDAFHGPWRGEFKFPEGKRRSLQELSNEFLLSLSGEEKERLFPLGLSNGVALECFDFVDAVSNNRPVDIDARAGLKAKCLAEAIFESAWSGQAVEVDKVMSGEINGYQRDINEYWEVPME